jgi:hypothetical protein
MDMASESRSVVLWDTVVSMREREDVPPADWAREMEAEREGGMRVSDSTA